MKRIMCILTCLCLLLVSGCTSGYQYQRDDSAGNIEKITIEEMQEKIDNKETFALVFTQSWCEHCKLFLEMLDGYLPTHNVTIYDVVLDEDPIEDQAQKLEIIRKTFPKMNSTPELYYVKDGAKEAQLVAGEDGITEESFDSWVQNYQLDSK